MCCGVLHFLADFTWIGVFGVTWSHVDRGHQEQTPHRSRVHTNRCVWSQSTNSMISASAHVASTNEFLFRWIDKIPHWSLTCSSTPLRSPLNCSRVDHLETTWGPRVSRELPNNPRNRAPEFEPEHSRPPSESVFHRRRTNLPVRAELPRWCPLKPYYFWKSSGVLRNDEKRQNDVTKTIF